MAMIVDGKVYRNIQEQVQENKENIEDLQGSVSELSTATNLENGATTGSLEQKFDGSTFNFLNPSSPLDRKTVTIGIASGTYAAMLGGKGRVEGNRGFVNGTQVIATGNYSHAEGNNTHAAGVSSHAEGIQTYAGGTATHSEGYQTRADSNYSHAEGNKSYASGVGAHAEGMGTRAIGNYSHAEGVACYANGVHSHAQGQDSTTNGMSSFASGFHVTANREYQTVLGEYNLGQNDTLFEVGNGTDNEHRSNAFEVYADGTLGIPNFNSSGIRIGTKRIKCINGVLTVID